MNEAIRPLTSRLIRNSSLILTPLKSSILLNSKIKSSCESAFLKISPENLLSNKLLIESEWKFKLYTGRSMLALLLDTVSTSNEILSPLKQK